MKDFSNFLSEKQFSCDVEGCSMASKPKFTNDDQLTVHKKRHDMILNLGLGQKGQNFIDQTPTPTQFIRNCEEVGLFQDLQNVNPFEETFKKAVEAVKSGQLSLDKSHWPSPADDTLHTPNVFPHITDVPNHLEACNKAENILQHEDILKNLPESEIICEPDITNSNKEPALATAETENLPLNNVKKLETNFVAENKVVLNVPDGHLVQLLTSENSQSSCNMVVIKNTVNDVFPPLPITVKEKLKKSLSEKKVGKSFQQKVPILKCPAKKTSSLSNKFSKFSKNAKKLISKLESSEVNKTSEDVHKKQKKNAKIESKESRSEFLARSRAASFRCREKKKMYLLYLEKVNSELLTANQNLMLINSTLQEEISDLHAELLKHKNCNAADKNTEAVLTASAKFISKKPTQNERKPETPILPRPTPPIAVKPSLRTNQYSESDVISDTSDLSSFSLDVAEVILDDGPEENEIPLQEGNKPPDIIVRFNSVGNDFPADLPTDCFLNQYIERAEENVKQIYGEHSYFLKKSIDKRFVNYKTFGETVEASVGSDCKKLKELEVKMKQNDAFRDITSLNTKVLVGQRTPSPLILLKPFKKRSIQNKTEKT